MNFCNFCGHNLAEIVRYCPRCGAQLAQTDDRRQDTPARGRGRREAKK